VNVLVLLLIVPEGLSQLAFAIPLWMQMLGLFDVTHHRLLGRWLALQVLIQQAFYQSQLGFILLYPVFRRFNKGLIHLGFLAAGFPFLSQVFIFVYDVLSQFEQTLRTYLVIYGRMNTLAWTLLIFWLVLYPRMNRWLHSALACVYMVFVIPLAQVPWVYELSMINVHQGDAFLISAPLNRVKVLIDTGPLSAYARLDTFLKAQGIRQIDYLIITHDDHDHSGSLEKLHTEYALGQVVLTSQNITHPWLVMIALTREDADNPNDNSLVYWTRIHTLSAIFLGDISLAQERQLSHLYPTLRADLVKIAHHGSNTSSSDALFSWIQAKVALIGVGRNRYGHPHPDVIQRLHENQLRIYQSLVHGDVTIYILPWFNLLRTSRDEFLVF
jgi:beta-lactamase superfamily II metal-dependent hydrolase